MIEQVTWEQLNKKGSQNSPAYKSNGHVFTSGNIGVDVSGMLPEDVKAQAENAITNIETVLKASGSSLDQVLKVLVFISDGKYVTEVNEVYYKYFASKPCRSCVIVGFPNPDVKVEIECIAQYEDIFSVL